MEVKSMIKKIKLGFAIALLSLQMSCSDYLDVKPMGRTIPSTPEEFDALLQTMLNDLDYGKTKLMPTNADLLDYECFADNLDMNIQAKSLDGNNRPNSLTTVYIGSRLSVNTSSYSSLYSIIRNCNIIIDNLQNNGSRYSKNIIGTSYAIRAIAYFQLIKDFCEPVDKTNISEQLGVPLVYTFDMEDRPIRSSLAASISRIESDLQTAISFQVEDELYRLTTDVAKGYLARLYFWAEEWDKAIKESKYLLDKHPLLSGAAYKAMMSSNLAPSGNILFKTDVYREASTNMNEANYMLYIKSKPLSKDFVELFAEKEKDVRYPLFMTSRRESVKKLYPCIRTDEMCLILAESYVHQGRTDSALFYLNHMRENRIEDYKPLTIESLPSVNTKSLITEDAEGKALTPLVQAVLNERRKELFLEADRWYELKRNGRPEFWRLFNNRTQKVVTQKFMYTFPLPSKEMVLVDGLIQNPGYTY